MRDYFILISAFQKLFKKIRDVFVDCKKYLCNHVPVLQTRKHQNHYLQLHQRQLVFTIATSCTQALPSTSSKNLAKTSFQGFGNSFYPAITNSSAQSTFAISVQAVSSISEQSSASTIQVRASIQARAHATFQTRSQSATSAQNIPSTSSSIQTHSNIQAKTYTSFNARGRTSRSIQARARTSFKARRQPNPSTNPIANNANASANPAGWKNDADLPPPVVPFVEHRRHNMSERAASFLTPLAVLLLFLDYNFFRDIAQVTNLYAAMHPIVHLQRQGSQRTRHHGKWKDVDEGIMKNNLGLLIAMGLNYKPEIRLYWSTNILHRMPFFGTVMSADRFFDVLRFLHVVDNRTQNNPVNSQIWKIRPLVDGLLSNFKSLYYPGKQLSLDEATCPYKGRVSFLTYKPKKPHKWGLKLFQICDSVTGYCCAFQVASGGSGPVYNLVHDLMQDYLGKGHELFVDRYYMSIPLFRELYTR